MVSALGYLDRTFGSTGIHHAKEKTVYRLVQVARTDCCCFRDVIARASRDAGVWGFGS